ncbi:Beta-1,3-glucosyltransferase [Desulfovibrio sp. DV]|uniref:glycosyltransferase family 2 protein n=1 Tax=Desulfovibrio sp. DV TaxID=1844708 RepID=UPI00094BC3F3|nr:glycosyltransferase family 2 protein [Desulfovibrio sp. DV]OLN24698.1 Beta-1,3-glucosyltransferase [Desulfovibrio sp. DV]
MFQIEEGLAGVTTFPRIRARGRYLFAGEDKFFIKGVTYGPFPENSRGEPLPEDETVAHDFELMRRAGINSIRVYYVPPRHFLDIAARFGIRVMIGVPWPQHLCFLDQWEVKEDIKKTIRESVASLAGHPAILAWLIGNEIPSHIVRWHGAGKVETFLEKLTNIVREEDPEGLVTYANYPSTEYLRLPFLDFLSFNVYLHDEKAFRSYVKRLQNVAGELPLVLSEFGMDSIRNDEEHVAETLAWQLRASFELGVSGTMVFAWTDEWFTGGHLVEDWKFGIVSEVRKQKPAYKAVADVYRQKLPHLPANAPFISVVVCAYNADSTMDGCLASFAKVDYPNFEVIVVDDGSTDATGEIADRHAAAAPYIHVIHQPNLGLSAARNVGMNAARGPIVAYTDSDCYVDPHWLHYMAWAFEDPRFVAVGGPNLPPPDDNRTAACVAVSPGAPTHVLLTDEIAEHIPGCNMAYRKDYLAGIGGFDATYRAAGDDVDVCWRLQDQGHVIGFSAAMFVWHHRRCTISAYLKQQKGYGRAEALLIPKHKFRFNMLGNSRWAGRIYGDISGALLAARPIVYHGAFGMGLFQTLYEPKGSLAAYLPLSMEWMVLALGLMLATPLSFVAGGIGLSMIAATLAFVGYRVSKARLPKRHDNLASRLTIAALTLAQPVLRGWTRYTTLLALTRSAGVNACPLPLADTAGCDEASLPRIGIFRRLTGTAGILAHRLSFHRFFWNNKGLERDELLGSIIGLLRTLGVSYAMDSGFSASSNTPPWDLSVRTCRLTTARLRVTVENHGGEKRFVRMAGSVLPSGLAGTVLVALIATGAALALVKPVAAIAAGAAALAVAGWMSLGLYRAAALVATITQYVMVTRPGCSAGEPKDERVVKVVRPQTAAAADEDAALPVEPVVAASEVETAAA